MSDLEHWDAQCLPMPSRRITLRFSRMFIASEMESLRRGFLPKDMDDRWCVRLREKSLDFYRSWSGAHIYRMPIEQRGTLARAKSIIVNDDPEQHRPDRDDESDYRTVEWLLSMVMTQDEPSPPSYVVDRIRRVAPIRHHVVRGSTPVVAFGDYRRASVATLGLNPSRVEFLNGKGKELDGAKRRLETLRSLHATSLTDLDDDHVKRIVQSCIEYFHRQPYDRWFKRLKEVLVWIGASFLDGSACHLDLVQWATDPTWAKLPPAVRKRLLAEDVGFLENQLRNENIKTILINGTGVSRQFEQAFGCVMSERERITAAGDKPTRMFVGQTALGQKVIAWSTNLQSSFGVTNRRRALIGQAVRRLLCEG